jgi:hypothetical protein
VDVVRRGFVLEGDFERVVFLAMEIIGLTNVDSNTLLPTRMNQGSETADKPAHPDRKQMHFFIRRMPSQ